MSEQNRARHVVCAAIRFQCGTVLKGARHHNIINDAHALGLVGLGYTQGFIDQNNVFMEREEAMEVVNFTDQPFNLIRNGGQKKELYSESLY